MNENKRFALVPKLPNGLEKNQSVVKRVIAGMVADTLALARNGLENSNQTKGKEIEPAVFQARYKILLTMIKSTGQEAHDRVSAHVRSITDGTHINLKTYHEATSISMEGKYAEYSRIFWALVAKGNDGKLAVKPDWSKLQGQFRIGDYEWHERDYRQIHIWAKALDLEPQEVIRRLLVGGGQGEIKEQSCLEKTIFADGYLLELCWNFDVLPLETFEWVEGLTLKKLKFVSTLKKSPTLALRLPFLTHLACQKINLTELDLSNVPMLTSINCSPNHLVKLDLSNVSRLTTLNCSSNNLTELDLTNVPLLTELDCSGISVERLDLSNMPMLTHLACSITNLFELDLSNVKQLTYLSCFDTQINKLELSGVPLLKELHCWNNGVTELDIRSIRNLRTLSYCKDTTRLIKRPDQNNQTMKISE